MTSATTAPDVLAGPHLARAWVIPVVTATGLAFLGLVNVERAIHGLFVSSLATLGINVSLLSVPLLLTGLMYPLGLRRAWPHTPMFLTGSLAVGLSLTLATLYAGAAVAVVAAALSVAAITPIAMSLAASHPQALVTGLVLGPSIHIATRAVNGTAPLAATSLGRWSLAVALIATATSWWLMRFEVGSPGRRDPGRRALAGFFALIFFEYQLIGSPSALSTLHLPGDPAYYRVMVLAAQLGLLVGLVFVLFLWGKHRDSLGAFGLIVYSFATLSVLSGWFVPSLPLWVLLSQASAVGLVAICIQDDVGSQVASGGVRAGIVQAAWLSSLLLHVFAARWSFFPEALWPLLRGKAVIYLALSHALIPALFVLGSRRRGT